MAKIMCSLVVRLILSTHNTHRIRVNLEVKRTLIV